MKNKLFPLFIVTLILSACGNSVDSKYFGDLPTALYNLVEEKIAMSEDIDKAKKTFNLEDAYELGKKVEDLEAEFTKEVSENSEDIIGTQIEAEISEGLPYKFTKAPVISKFNFKNICLDFKISYEIEATEDIPLELTTGSNRYDRKHAHNNIYYKYLDKSDNIILQVCERGFIGDLRYKKPANYRWGNSWDEIKNITAKVGTKSEKTISIFLGNKDKESQLTEIKTMAGLDKIVFITEAEFNSNKESLSEEQVNIKKYYNF